MISAKKHRIDNLTIIPFIVLYDVKLIMNNYSNIERSEFFYSVAMSDAMQYEDTFEFECHLQAGRKTDSGSTSQAIQAIYGIAYAERTPRTKPLWSDAALIVRSAVWSKYSDLVAIIENQLDTKLRKFPSEPGFVDKLNEANSIKWPRSLKIAAAAFPA